jgi:LuxR family maltose regulon positive regulatory protein
VRIFIDEGASMRRLLRQATANGIAFAYAGRLLKALEEEAEKKRRQGTTAQASMVDPLSERELKVLRLLTTHLSSSDIAQELTISVNTVRTHIKSIYSKLNAHSRNEAVQRAKELDIL